MARPGTGAEDLLAAPHGRHPLGGTGGPPPAHPGPPGPGSPTTYQPGSRFWPFQRIEGGWLLALSVLLIGTTVWLVRRRAA